MPIRWVRANADWSSMDRSTCDSAAKFTTASTPSMASRTAVGILDRAHHERHVRGQVLPAPGVGELVEHHHVVLARHQVDVGRSDEPGRSGHQQLHARTSRSAR